jgi:hypothetical protein
MLSSDLLLSVCPPGVFVVAAFHATGNEVGLFRGWTVARAETLFVDGRWTVHALVDQLPTLVGSELLARHANGDDRHFGWENPMNGQASTTNLHANHETVEEQFGRLLRFDQALLSRRYGLYQRMQREMPVMQRVRSSTSGRTTT